MRHTFYLLLILAFSTAALAVDHPVNRLTALEGKLRLGMEIELPNTPLSNLVDYFEGKPGTDLRKYFLNEKEDLLTRDYVQSEEAYKSLPENIRAQLSHGLNLNQSLIIQPQLGSAELPKLPAFLAAYPPPPARPLIVLPGDASPRTQSGIVLPPDLKLPKNNPVPPPKRMDGLTDWQLLNAAWNQLPAEQRRDLVNFEHIGRKKKAQLILKNYRDFQFKQPAPAFLKGLVFEPDTFLNGILEFKHDSEISVTKAQSFFKQVQDFSKRAGVESEIMRPELSSIGTVSLHIHISLPPGGPYRDLENVSKELTKWIALQTVHRGEISMLKFEVLNGYVAGPLPNQKSSVIRKLSSRRVELRAPLIDLEDNLPFILENLSEPDEKLAIKRIKSDYARWLDDETFVRILKFSSSPEMENELLAGSKYAEILSEAKNPNRLPVARFEQRMSSLAQSLGMNWENLRHISSLQEGILVAPDSMSAQNSEKTIETILIYIKKHAFVTDELLDRYASVIDEPTTANRVIETLKETDWISPKKFITFAGIPYLTKLIHQELLKEYLAGKPGSEDWGEILLGNKLDRTSLEHFLIGKRIAQLGKGYHYLTAFLGSSNVELADMAYDALKNSRMSSFDILAELRLRPDSWRTQNLLSEKVREGDLVEADRMMEYLLHIYDTWGFQKEAVVILLKKNAGVHRPALEELLHKISTSNKNPAFFSEFRNVMKDEETLAEYRRCMNESVSSGLGAAH